MNARQVMPMLAALAMALLAAPPESRAANGERMVVSPRAGQVVEWHQVRVRVRSSSLEDTLRVRLNGTRIGAEFGRPVRGVRTLWASVSHGLRRGNNVLRVTVRRRDGAPRRATVRFIVRTKRRLVGAGWDRPVAVAGTVRLRGHVSDAAGSRLRWKLVRAPRRAGNARAARLSSAAGPTAGFRPSVPGRYTLSLTAGGSDRAAADTVTLSALPRSRLVPIETMTATDAGNGDQRGIRVGDTTYLLRDAKYSEPSGSVLQVLVLKRDTLEFVSNTKYLDAPDLSDLDERHLVILVLQPGGLKGFQYGGLNKAVARIGAPDMGDSLPKNTGLMSAIGVPGMSPGDADVNMLVGPDSGRLASMKGYLTPDQWGNYGFVPSERKPFSFKPSPAGCTPGKPCDVRIGFRVRHLDSRTGAPAAHDGEIYNTNGHDVNSSQKAAEARRMLNDLTAVPKDNVVMIETVSIPGSPFGYGAPIGAIDRDTLSGLARAVESLGGTRNGFNRIALKPGAEASGGLTYALVGWKGAREGEGAEVAAGVDGAGEAPELSGMLLPDRQSRLRPAGADGGDNSLAELVLDEPTSRWPLDDDAGAKDALSFLGSTNEKLGPDPRARYASQPFGQAGWDRIADEIKAVEYADVPTDRRKKFTEAQFLAARNQLVRELGWVGNVRAYLEQLKSPIANAGVISYSDVIGIGDRVYKDIERPESSGLFSFLELVETMFELMGPATHEVSATVAGLMQLGTIGFEAGENGAPAREVQFRARELGAKITEEMQATARTYAAMGDVIVTDPAKLAFVGENGDCEPTEDDCPEGYSFTAKDVRSVYADLYRSIERTAYEELVPLAYATYALNPEHLNRAPEAKWYRCTDLGPLFPYYPFWDYSDVAQAKATAAERLEIDPGNPSNDLWQLLVLSRPRRTSNRGQPPADDILNRMFERVPRSSDNPREGGLGMSLARLMPGADRQTWAPFPRQCG